MKQMANELAENMEVTSYFAVRTLELRKSRKENYYLALTLADRTGSIKGYFWKDAKAAAETLKDRPFAKVRGIVKTVNNALAVDINKMRPADSDEVEMADILEVVSEGLLYWQKRLHEAVKLIKDSDCLRLCRSFLWDLEFMSRFVKCPSGVTVHHAYIGGLMQHTVCGMELAASLADRYPDLIDRDKAVTGAFLRDIGKTRELRYETVREYTTEGKLLGHILIGITMIEEKIIALKDFPDELALDLKHLIISHHGEPDYGSPVRPTTPEALALHMIDNAAAKLNHLHGASAEFQPRRPLELLRSYYGDRGLPGRDGEDNAGELGGAL